VSEEDNRVGLLVGSLEADEDIAFSDDELDGPEDKATKNGKRKVQFDEGGSCITEMPLQALGAVENDGKATVVSMSEDRANADQLSQRQKGQPLSSMLGEKEEG